MLLNIIFLEIEVMSRYNLTSDVWPKSPFLTVMWLSIFWKIIENQIENQNIVRTNNTLATTLKCPQLIIDEFVDLSKEFLN